MLPCFEPRRLRKWHFSYEKHANRITIWPFLQAAGWEERHKKILDAFEKTIEEHEKILIDD